MGGRNSMQTNDRMIREAFKARLIARHAGEDAVIVEELKTARGSGRLDLAVINGKIEGIEIKSDLDTLARLPRQAGHFEGAADRMTIVVGRRHIREAMNLVPEWWTVIEATAAATGRVVLKTRRRGSQNRRLDPRSLAMLLDREELIALLGWHGLDAGFRTANYITLADRASACIPKAALAPNIRELLKRRARYLSASSAGAFGRSAVICG